MSALAELARIGVVVHPTRAIDRALDGIRSWAGEHDVEVVQVPVDGQERQVADERDAADCDLVMAIGGDGTMLAAASAAAYANKPVLGVACGSLGVLTAVTADEVGDALDRFASGDWFERKIPALEIDREGHDQLRALNDVAITRKGQGQVMASVEIDGVLYARFVGDGFVVSTPVGSSGYTLAAGGPLLAPGSKTFCLTPLASHGGSIPPLVVGTHSKLVLEIEPGFGGIRLELDGRMIEWDGGTMTVALDAEAATLVLRDEGQSILAGLRRKKLIMDSPRVLARDQREGGS